MQGMRDEGVSLRSKSKVKNRSIAEEFNQSYKEGVIEIVIDQAIYDQYFKPLEYRYDEKDDCERIEVVVPQNLFPILNQFPRFLKPR